MNDVDEVLALQYIRERLRLYGGRLIEDRDPHAIYKLASDLPTKISRIDGEAELIFSMPAGNADWAMHSWPMDLTHSVGAIIDGFNTMLTIKFGPPPLPEYYAGTTNQKNYAPTPGVISASGHTHQFAGVLSDPQVTFTPQPSSTSYIQKQLEEVLCSTVASQEEKVRAAHALTGLRSTNKRGIIARLLGP